MAAIRSNVACAGDERVQVRDVANQGDRLPVSWPDPCVAPVHREIHVVVLLESPRHGDPRLDGGATGPPEALDELRRSFASGSEEHQRAVPRVSQWARARHRTPVGLEVGTAGWAQIGGRSKPEIGSPRLGYAENSAGYAGLLDDPPGNRSVVVPPQAPRLHLRRRADPMYRREMQGPCIQGIKVEETDTQSKLQQA